MDVSDCVTQSLSADETELPELDIDPRALLASQSSQVYDGISNTGLFTNQQKIGTSKYSTCENNLTNSLVKETTHTNQNLSDELKQSSFVFDPVVGVIPRETRDLWFESAKSTSRIPISSDMSVNSMPLDSSVDRTISSAVTDKSVTKKMRVLPPVRYSNIDSTSRSVGHIVE